MSRYIVIGAGAVGATVGAQLHRADIPVVLVARGDHLQALRDNGLRYVRPDGGGGADVQIIELPLADGPGQVRLQADDVLVFATKSQDTEAALQEWAWQPVEQSGAGAAEVLPVLLLQNGLDNERSALRRFATVIGAVVAVPSSYLTPGEVVSPAAPTVGAFWLGAFAPQPGGGESTARRVAADLVRAGFAAEVVDDILAWKAGKLLANLAHNIDALYRPSELRDAAGRALRAEALTVLRAGGIEPLDLQAPGALGASGVVTRTIAGHERGGSSTWQSRARGSSLETDFINGEIVLLARLHEGSAPLNTAVQARLARAARDSTPPGGLDDADLLATLPDLATRGPDPAVTDRNGRGAAAVLIDPAELSADLAGPTPPVLLDVRWALGDVHGHDHYRDGHIPGAVYVDLDTELAAPPSPARGRHPLPGVEDLQAAARRWGISNGRPVVVYDDLRGLSAARAWWLLRWAGLPDVRILDGALTGWVRAGFDTETGENPAAPGDVDLDPGQLAVLDADGAAALTHDGVLLDARAGERYRGETEPVDPQAGHIPGAVSAPTTDNVDARGRFLPAEQLRRRFGDLGAGDGTPVGVYCGSGVTASHEIAALAVAGIGAALYPGSWSAWSSDPHRPVATGTRPREGE